MSEIVLNDGYVSNVAHNAAVQAAFPALKEIAGTIDAKSSKKCNKCGEGKKTAAQAIDRARQFILAMGPEQSTQLKSILGVNPQRKFLSYVVGGNGRSQRVTL